MTKSTKIKKGYKWDFSDTWIACAFVIGILDYIFLEFNPLIVIFVSLILALLFRGINNVTNSINKKLGENK